MIDVRHRRNFDFALLAVSVAIVLAGIITIYSAGANGTVKYWQKQALWVLPGSLLMAGGVFLDHTRLTRYSKVFYTVSLLLLLLVRFKGVVSHGARRWIMLGSFQFQPSEVVKLFMIVALATYISSREKSIDKLSTLLGSLLYVGVPTLLIFKQPDLGTALVLVAIWFGMVIVAGAKWAHLCGIVVVGLALFAAMWKLNILHDYQKNRLLVVVNPQYDAKDTGYHVMQSRIAIGSGKVTGKGFRQGSQVQGRFIPENHTDFIFAVIGEEAGFVGAGIVVLLYGCLLYRGLRISEGAEDTPGRLMAAGITSMFAFHIIVNIGMTIGIMPVTGVPLPLFSYGGTSLWLNMAAIGLLLGIGMRRHRLAF
jgi:rod shape determining protein RodA